MNDDSETRLRELALTSLVNLSIAESNENTIIEQGVIGSVLRLVTTCENERLSTTGCMLLSNLLTNENARAKIRGSDWLNPIIQLIKSNSVELVIQVVRIIINIAFDEICRYQLVQAQTETLLKAADSRLKNKNLSDLIASALKNLSVPVSEEISGSRGNTGNTGNTGTTQTRPQKNDIDNILEDMQTQTYVPPKTQTQTQTRTEIRTETNPRGTINQTKTETKTFSPQVQQSRNVSVEVKNNTPKSTLDDLDDILKDITTQPLTSNKTTTNIMEQTKLKDRPITQRISQKYKNDFDDIDQLLSGMNTENLDDVVMETNFEEPNEEIEKKDPYDIDDILNDIDKPQNTPPPRNTTNLDDIDDILKDLTSTPKSTPKTTLKTNNETLVRTSTSTDLDSIDELLKDLNLGI